MEDQQQFNMVIMCQRSIQELVAINSRFEKRLELQEAKLSQLSLHSSQRNEDVLQALDKYTTTKQYREDSTYLRNYLESKTKALQGQIDQIQIQLNSQMTLLREELTLANTTAVEKATRLVKDALFKVESVEKAIHLDTALQIEQLTKKAGEMEQTMMNLFSQKQKLLERITLSQETQIAKLNVFESALHQHGTTISKLKNQGQNQGQATPYQSGKKLNFDSEVPIELLKRQESVLNTVTMSIKNIERRLAENESQPKVKRELSFDQYSMSVQKPESQGQRRNQYSTNLDFQKFKDEPPSMFKATTPKSNRSRQKSEQERLRTDESQEFSINMAQPLQHEAKSPTIQSNRDISKHPILKKASPKPIVSSPSSNIYEEMRLQQEYEMRMAQMRIEEEQQRQQQQKRQSELDNKLAQMRNSISQISNESQMMKNDSYIMRNDSSMLQNSQDLKRSSSGLRSLLEKSKEREKEVAQGPRVGQQSQSQHNKQQGRQGQNPGQQGQRQQGQKGQGSAASKFESLSKLQPVSQPVSQPKSRTSQMRNLAKQQRMQQQQSEEELVYQLDEDGYLMDEQGNYLLDERGNYIQISDKDLEDLKRQNLVVEQ